MTPIKPVQADLKTICQMYGRKYQTLWLKMKAGEFVTPYRDGRRVFFDLQEVDAWMHREPVKQIKPSIIREAFETKRPSYKCPPGQYDG